MPPPLSLGFKLFRKVVDFGGEDEVALGQAIHLVRPGGDFNLAPGQQDVGMMALLFRDGADPIDKVERGLEVREGVGAADVVFIDDPPLRKLVAEVVQFLTL